MDVDGGALNSEQHDLEQSLLQEFSRMGTRDKDDLINQMQKLLGPELSYNSATFFLDMNNWNLQDAVCSYLDFVPTIMMPSDIQRPVSPIAFPMPAPVPVSSPPTVDYQMTLVSPKGQCSDPHPPGTKVEWVWIVKNSGMTDWPEGCVVLTMENLQPIAQLPAVKCKDVYFINHNLTTPPSIGIHSQLFRLCTPQGEAFGDELWVRLKVQYDESNSMQAMEQCLLDENM